MKHLEAKMGSEGQGRSGHVNAAERKEWNGRCRRYTNRINRTIMRGVALLLTSFSGFAQTTVLLNGNTYTLQSHPRVWLDGASGTLTAAMSNTGANGRALSTNPPYAALQNRVNTYVSNGYTDPMVDYLYYDNSFVETPGDLSSSTLNAALLWVAQGSNASDPNGYLAAAKYGIDHALRIVGNSTGCNTSYTYCGPFANNGRGADLDYTRTFMINLAQAFSLIHGQLSPAEISTFANVMLNDNLTTHNGIDTNACTNQGVTLGTGTLTTSGLSTSVTISGGTTSQFVSGSVIFNPDTATMNPHSSADQPTTIVNTIIDSTHFTTYEPINASSTAFSYSAPWTTGNCGIIWLVKHHNAAPPLIPVQAASYNTDYYNGNSYVAPDGNLTLTSLVGYIAVGLALADDDSRAVTLLQEAYDYYYTNMYPYTLSAFTGFTSSGNAYTQERTDWMNSSIAEMILKSVVSGPNLLGTFVKRQNSYLYHLTLPDAPAEAITFQQPYQTVWDSLYAMRAFYLPIYLESADSQAAYANYYLRTVRSDYTSGGVAYNKASYTAWAYVFMDPAQTSTNYNAQPTQFLFNDADYSTCVSLGLTCYENHAYAFAVSRSGWTSTDDLALLTTGFTDGADHSSNGDWGDFRIYRNGASTSVGCPPCGYLLGDDWSSYSEGQIVGENEVMIELGNGANWNNAGGNAPLLRWASTDPTGDSSSRYMYAMTDLTTTYNSSVSPTRVQRHVAHFKKSGAQDYFVVYDDVAASATTICSLWHYALDGVAYGTAINFTANTGPLSNTQAASSLNTAWIYPGGSTTGEVNTDGAGGTYSGGNGYTYRVRSCASADGSTQNSSATTFREIVVHEPVNGASSSMPPVAQLSAANFDVVQIADPATPKVAAFAQGGVTYTSATFTSTHAGTGQYLIAGLSPGTYTVALNGSAILSNQTVVAGDNTLYFESSSGAFSITQTGSTLLLSCDLNGDGVVNIQDVQISGSSYLGTIPCLPQYQLDQSGTCTVVDVQRVVAAALGLGCKIGP